MDNKTFFDQTIDDFFNSQEDNLIYYYIPEEETDIINSIKKT